MLSTAKTISGYSMHWHLLMVFVALVVQLARCSVPDNAVIRFIERVWDYEVFLPSATYAVDAPVLPSIGHLPP